MKKSEMYKEIIKDVIAASGGEITDGYFDRLNLLFKEYHLYQSREEMQMMEYEGE